MSKQKLKMSNKRFMSIFVPICAILLALTIGLFVVADNNRTVLNSQLGRGTMHVIRAEGTENWDAEYYGSKYKSHDEAKAASNAVSEKVTDEGIVLLKNNGVLPLGEKTSVAPFGYAYMNPTYSGTGAAATNDSDEVSPQQALEDHFTVNAATVNRMKSASASYPDAAAGTNPLDWDKNSIQGMMQGGKHAQINEYDANIYVSIKNDVTDSIGIIFISREGSEGLDKRTEAYDDGTPHYLALTAREKATIAFSKANCKNTVVILNTANPIEVAPLMSGEYEADAVLWIGKTGSRGFASMGKILCGEVNPSGRLTDIYAADFTKDPTFQNFGEYSYTNSKVTDYMMFGFLPGANKGTMDRKFVEYEEGIYIGYRYYETAAVVLDSFTYGTLDGKGAIVTPGAVAYPFGYGLSYTTFSQEILSFESNGENVTVTVKVTNTGKMAGKEVVQVYYTAPYTDENRRDGVEKSVTVLGGFTKTKMLKSGDSDTVTVSFAKEDMASYNYHHNNDDGTVGCYQLDAGEYTVEIKSNSHDVIDSRNFTINKTVYYVGDNARQSEKDAQSLLDDEGNPLGVPANGKKFVAASNNFQTMNAYMDDVSVTKLSRNNWSNTFPTAPTDRKGTASQVALDEFVRSEFFDWENDPILGNVEGSLVYTDEKITTGAENGLSLIDMRGLDYYDEAWDSLLDQIDWDDSKDKEQIIKLLFEAAYATPELTCIGKPSTVDADGAMGWISAWLTMNAAAWASANLVSCTWNLDLMYEMGAAMGQEGLALGIHGWYAPAVNIHRSPFSGRIYEYYSEDPLISGKVAAAIVSGTGDNGVFPYLKHFALNDQETWRSVYLATWATEQATREIYLKAFEVCVKEAQSTIKYISDENGTVANKTIRSTLGIMSAQCCIGGTIGFAHYGLLTGVLRNEWGFTGGVVTDFYPNSLVNTRDMMLRAGGDMWMTSAMMGGGIPAYDYDSPTIRAIMREAIHHIGYMVVNSHAMNSIVPGSVFYYDMASWEIGLITGSCIIWAGIAAVIVWGSLRFVDSKKHPEKYRRKEKI